MSKILTFFLLAVFAFLFCLMTDAEAIPPPDETLIPLPAQLEGMEPIAAEPDAEVRDAESVAFACKWPNYEHASPVTLDIHDALNRMNSPTEGRAERNGIRSGGESRL